MVIAQPRHWGYGVVINETPFRVAASPEQPLELGTAPLQPPRISTEERAEDFADTFGRIFSRETFRGGEGLERAHRPDGDARDATRYWDSWNVDVFPDLRSAEPAAATLLREMPQLIASTEANLRLRVRSYSELWWNDGNSVKFTTNPTAASPTVNTEDPHVGEGAQLVRFVIPAGTEVYAALAVNGIHRRNAAGVWAHFNDLLAQGMNIVKGRILAWNDNNLYEIPFTAGTAIPTATLTIATGATFTAIADVGAAVLVAADDGYIYSFAEEQGVLSLKGQTLIEGETPQALVGTRGSVFFVTSQPTDAGGTLARFWQADLNEAFVLDNWQLLKEFGDDTTSVNLIPRRMLATRDSVYLGVRVPTPDVATYGGANLWRYHLPTAALTRSFVVTDAGAVPSLVSIEDTVFAGVGSKGIYREDKTSFAEFGWLIGPLADHFTASDKQWVSGRLDLTAISAGGGRVELWYSTDPRALDNYQHASWVLLLTVSGEDSFTNEVDMLGVSGRWLAGQIRIYSAANQATAPRFQSYSFRSYPSPEPDVLIAIPVDVSDHIEMPNRKRLRVKGHGQRTWATLRAMEGDEATIDLLRPDEEFRGIIEEVGARIPGFTLRGSPTIISTVRFRGQRVVTATVGGGGSVGAGLGISGLGTGGLG